MENTIVELEKRHRTLDQQITKLTKGGWFDSIAVTALKALKLQLKDQIAAQKELLRG